MLKSQSKVKELTRELRNKTEESDEYKRKMETLKNERRRGEKTISEVNYKSNCSSYNRMFYAFDLVA